MYKVNVSSFYTFAKWTNDLRGLRVGESCQDLESFRRLLATKIGMMLYLDPSIAELGFPHTKDVLKHFSVFLDRYTDPSTDPATTLNPDRTYTQEFIDSLNSYIDEFERFFIRESMSANVFAVTAKGIYDLTQLIENASACLPKTALDRLSEEAKDNINAAGRCLALESPTACGFHMLRAVESLMRDYHFKLAGTTLLPKSRNWGAFIKQLNCSGADPKITGYLTHIKDFYRNPIVHPDENLTSDQAHSLFTASLSAITMLDAATNL